VGGNPLGSDVMKFRLFYERGDKRVQLSTRLYDERELFRAILAFSIRTGVDTDWLIGVPVDTGAM
jgi:hypothetical protein